MSIMQKGFARYFEKFTINSYKNRSDPKHMELKKWVSVACNNILRFFDAVQMCLNNNGWEIYLN